MRYARATPALSSSASFRTFGGLPSHRGAAPAMACSGTRKPKSHVVRSAASVEQKLLSRELKPWLERFLTGVKGPESFVSSASMVAARGSSSVGAGVGGVGLTASADCEGRTGAFFCRRRRASLFRGVVLRRDLLPSASETSSIDARSDMVSLETPPPLPPPPPPPPPTPLMLSLSYSTSSSSTLSSGLCRKFPMLPALLSEGSSSL
mmetsp:Transcript_12030/g.44666  ORF Transcript_12030/g.44666 Transcript_12030/m.44666 type:complete len:207 (+) Transcript_12030:1243-1863(+)